jgi:hypothetical protein
MRGPEQSLMLSLLSEAEERRASTIGEISHAWCVLRRDEAL